MDQLIEAFDLDRVGKSGSRFDPEKAKWFNHHYLKERDNHELAKLFMPILKEKGIEKSEDFVAEVCRLIKERATFVSDFWALSYYFFASPENFDEKVVKKFWKENTPAILAELSTLIGSIENFEVEVIDKALHNWIAEKQLGMGQVMNSFRLCMVGTSMGPGMAEIAAVVGKKETLKRIQNAIQTIRVS